MLLFVLGLSLLSASTLADSPLYIEELEDLVYGPDHVILDALDDDKWTPRAELKIKVDEILARQSPETQRAYERTVEIKEGQRKAKNNFWQGRADEAGVGNLYEKLKQLQTDMTVTESEAHRRAAKLWFDMNIRRGSSSEEHYMYSRHSRDLTRAARHSTQTDARRRRFH